jgi:hypothetical protein
MSSDEINTALVDSSKVYHKKHPDTIPNINDEILKSAQVIEKPEKIYSENTNDKLSGILRYAGVAGQGVASLASLLSKPNTKASKEMAALGVTPQLLGDYMRYTPMDRDYYTNKLSANAAASRSAIANMSGGNRAALMSGILGSDYSYNRNLGELARHAEEYNLAQRQMVSDFNRGTNQFNAGQLSNAQLQNNQYRLNAIQAMENASQNKAATRSANLSGFLNSLTDMGNENAIFNMIRSNPNLNYEIDRSGKVTFKNK